VESLINDCMSRRFVPDPVLLLPQNFPGVEAICAYIHAREPGR
jgi:hypothetical protein